MRGKWVSVLLSIEILLSACGQNDSEKMQFHMTETAEEYIAMPYHKFKERTGKEAEFYHGERFIGEIPDSALCVIYEGEYDEDVAAAVLSDDDMPIRIQGSMNALLDGMTEEMTVIELADILSANGAAEASYELLEGGGTAYYVGNWYVRIKFDSDRNGEYDRVLLISMDGAEEEMIGMEREAWLEIFQNIEE